LIFEVSNGISPPDVFEHICNIVNLAHIQGHGLLNSAASKMHRKIRASTTLLERYHRSSTLSCEDIVKTLPY
jgi:hypothetical protein